MVDLVVVMPITVLFSWLRIASALAVAPSSPDASANPDNEPMSSSESPAVRAGRLRLEYERLYGEGEYAQARSTAEEACRILRRTSGKSSIEHADCLFDLGSILSRQGELADAEQTLQRALAIYRRKGSASDGFARVLNEIGSVRLAQGDYRDARAYFDRALAIHRGGGTSDSLEAARVISNQALLHYARGEYDVAIELLNDALAIRKARLGTNHMDTAETLNNLGVLYQEVAIYNMSESVLVQALQISEDLLGPNHPDVANVLGNLATLYQFQGKLEESALLSERVLEITEAALGEGHPDVATCLNNLAEIYGELGELSRAEMLLRRALRIRVAILGPGHPRVATTTRNLGGLLQQQGRLDEAESLLLKAVEINEGALPPDHPELASSINDLASLYSDFGEMKKARVLLKRVHEIYTRTLGPNHPYTISCKNNLGLLYHRAGELAEAETLLSEALDANEVVLGADHVDTAASRSNLAALYQDQGKHDRATPLYAHALSTYERSLHPNHPRIAQTASSYAALQIERGSYEEAEPLLNRALEIFEKSSGHNHGPVANCLRQLGIVYRATGRRELAIRAFWQAFLGESKAAEHALVADDLRQLAHTGQMLASTNFVMSLQLQASGNDEAISELALSTLINQKGRAQDWSSQVANQVRRSLAEDEQHVLDEIARNKSSYAALAHRTSAPEAPESLWNRLAKLEREQDVLWARLASSSPRARALTELVTIADVQARLPRDAAIIEYVRYQARRDMNVSAHEGSPHYAAYLLQSGRFAWIDLGPADAIDEQIGAFREVIARKADVSMCARILYESVMKPVVDDLGSTTRLFISPDGNLNLVSFEALVDEHDDYFVERFQLHYLISSRDLLRPWALEPLSDGPVVVVANPTDANLPASEHEAAIVAALFPRAVTLEHDEATESRLRSHEHPRILHLATHGAFGSDRVEDARSESMPIDDRSESSVFEGLSPTQLDNPTIYSWLALTAPATPLADGAGRVDLDDEGALPDDGRLTAYEISGMDLRGTELVTLSACSTGQGQYQQGEGILSLRRAFAIAGARTQVMSLWRVSDSATATLMASYYRRLLAGEGRSEAMRNTQLKMLHDPATRHPRDWAAFVVVGEWGPLSGTTNAAPPPLAPSRGCRAAVGQPSERGTALALVLVLLGLLHRRRRRIEGAGYQLGSGGRNARHGPSRRG